MSGLKTKTLILKKNVLGCCEIILNQPKKHNALSPLMIQELDTVFDELKEDRSIRFVIISANGKTFCAGGDLDWMKEQINADRKTRIREASKLANILYKMYNFSKPLIAKVEGNAFGGGVGIMSVCDIVVATENIKMALTETKLGLIPATISPYVISKIGSNNSIDLFTSARIFKPKEAKDMGLIKSFVDEANIDDEIRKEVYPFSMNAPDAISASKKLVRDLSIKIDLDTINFTVEALADVWENPEAIEGINAFFAKRKPAWIKEN
tara:strand:+ start:74 stop:874 length:801 start_codon:yes stop_codon:yes gene_type:complete